MKINITNFRNNTLKLFGSKTVKNRKANTLNVTMNRNVSNQISSFLEGPSSRHFLKKKSKMRNEMRLIFCLCCCVFVGPRKKNSSPCLYFRVFHWPTAGNKWLVVAFSFVSQRRCRGMSMACRVSLRLLGSSSSFLAHFHLLLPATRRPFQFLFCHYLWASCF